MCDFTNLLFENYLQRALFRLNSKKCLCMLYGVILWGQMGNLSLTPLKLKEAGFIMLVLTVLSDNNQSLDHEAQSSDDHYVTSGMKGAKFPHCASLRITCWHQLEKNDMQTILMNSD